MKIHRKSELLRGKVKLAGLALLCLPLYSSAMPTVTQTEEQPATKAEAMKNHEQEVAEGHSALSDEMKQLRARYKLKRIEHSPPEGFHTLPVTEFRVHAEKEGPYTIFVYGEYYKTYAIGSSLGRRKFLNNIKGQLDVYYSPHSYSEDYPLIKSYSLFHPYQPGQTDPTGGADNAYLYREFVGEFYSLWLKEGYYIIAPNLYFSDTAGIKDPHILISFGKQEFSK